MRDALLTLALVLALGAGCAGPPPQSGTTFPGGDLVDLTHPYDAQTLYWPTAEPFALRVDAAGVTPDGYYYAANSFFTAEHGGTHLDAPVHFAEGRATVDQIPLERLLAAAVVIDVVPQSNRDADYQVSVDDVLRFEAEYGMIPAGAIVLLRTGFASRWPDAAGYLGTAARGADAVADLHFPGLAPEAAQWIVDNRAIAAIGIDTASIDYGQSVLFESHRILYDRDVPAFENLAALDRLPVTGAFVIALPMKIGGGSGAPLRAVAVVP